MYLVVGLGNPGSQYAGTRHNVGWLVADELAAAVGWINKPADFDRQARDRFKGLAMDGYISGQKVMILKPTTFMNLSGQSVQAAMAFHQVDRSQLMVLLDDLALPCGKIRIRPGGSSGGHNGLKDIERALAGQDYARLRLGIDAPPPPMAGKDYVLGAFTTGQRQLLEPAVARACEAVITWIERGVEVAMNRYNQSASDEAEDNSSADDAGE
jgi:PTH1 family peptidyl-tRNA hydrolase